MREYATTFSQTSCNPLDYRCLRLLTDESATQLLPAKIFSFAETHKLVFSFAKTRYARFQTGILSIYRLTFTLG